MAARSKNTFGELAKAGAPFVKPKQVKSASSKITENYGYLDIISRLKMARDDNQKSKAAEELAKPKEMAKSLIRARLEVKQHEYIEVKAREIRIAEETKASLREEYATQIKEEKYSQYDKISAAHMEEEKLELIKQLTRKIKASLKARYPAQAKDEVTEQEQSDGGCPVDEVLGEAPPSSTFRGVKRSREQEDDQDSLLGLRPKRTLVSFYEEEEIEGQGRGKSDAYGSSFEDAIDLDSEFETEAFATPIAAPVPPLSALRGIKRSFEQAFDEEDNWGRSPKRARTSCYR